MRLHQTLRLLVLAGSLLITMTSNSQSVAINTTGNPADPSAMLDITSTAKGLLIPRMTAAQRTAIGAPVEGLMVYQTDAPVGFYFYKAGLWTPLLSGPGGFGTLNFVPKWTPNGITLGNSMIFDDGTFVGIGTATPAEVLDVNGNINAQGDLYLKNQKVLNNDGFGRTQFFHAADGVEHIEFNGSNTHIQNKQVFITPNLGVGLDPNFDAIAAKLDVKGTVKITDGTEGVGKFFVDDGAGVGIGKWSTLAAAGVVTGTGVATRVAFWDAASSLSSNANLFWDNTSSSLGIGNATPAYKLDVLHGGGEGIRSKSSATFSVVDIDASSGDAALRFQRAGTGMWNTRNRPADNFYEIFELGGGGSRMIIQRGTGYVGIGGAGGAGTPTDDPDYQLDVLNGGGTGIRSKSSSTFSVVDIDAASGDAALRFQNAGTGMWNTRNNPGMADSYQIFELGGGGERMRIDRGTGKVWTMNDLHVGGTLSKAAGAFKIDHPLDPANKYLVHSFVESPDMMNIYNGNVVTDASGKVTVKLPDYFEALNMEFRYQLTVIGAFAQAIINKEVSNNQFEIATNQPNVKVSWQVTGVRHDPYANKNRIPNSIDKEAENIGKYLSPASYNLPDSKRIGYSDPNEGSLKTVQKLPAKTALSQSVIGTSIEDKVIENPKKQ